MFWNEHNPHPCSTSLPPYHHQDSYKVRENLSGCLIFLFLPSHLWLQVFTHYCLSLPLPYHSASLWMWHKKTTSSLLSCPEVLVEFREWHAIGLFVIVLKNGRMASLQEQMALHAWHNFLRQTRTRAVNTGICLL